MKDIILFSLLLTACASHTVAVPSEINYQGRLTDANGDAVTGDVAMSLKMFDAATEGNEIYSEDIGTVTLDSNGIYSFEFGASGQSVVSTSELIATTDGTNSIFNATLENLPVDGSVSVSDGTYTWSQANGSSSSTEFTASVTPSSGAVSAIYLGGAPTASTDITANYNYLDTTVSGAFSSHNSHWLELSVDGTAQSPRERVLSVPFAQVAGSANQNPRSESILNKILLGMHGLLQTDFQSDEEFFLDNSVSVDRSDADPYASNSHTVNLNADLVRDFMISISKGRGPVGVSVTYNYTDETQIIYPEFGDNPSTYSVSVINPNPEKLVTSIEIAGIGASPRLMNYNVVTMDEGQVSFTMQGILDVGQWNIALKPNTSFAFNNYDLAINLFNDADELIASLSEDKTSFTLKTPQNLDEVQITWSISGPPINSGTTTIRGFSLLGPF